MGEIGGFLGCIIKTSLGQSCYEQITDESYIIFGTWKTKQHSGHQFWSPDIVFQCRQHVTHDSTLGCTSALLEKTSGGHTTHTGRHVFFPDIQYVIYVVLPSCFLWSKSTCFVVLGPRKKWHRMGSGVFVFLTNPDLSIICLATLIIWSLRFCLIPNFQLFRNLAWAGLGHVTHDSGPHVPDIKYWILHMSEIVCHGCSNTLVIWFVLDYFLWCLPERRFSARWSRSSRESRAS